MIGLGITMVWNFLKTPVIAAAAVAAKNVAILVPAQAAAGLAAFAVDSAMSPNLSVEGLSTLLGPRLVAMIFAVIGAFWRWHRFKLSFHMGVSGCFFSTTLAFIIGDGQVPYADALTKNISRESIPMMNGFLMGLFGLLLVTGVQDFMSAYRAAKKAGVE